MGVLTVYIKITYPSFKRENTLIFNVNLLSPYLLQQCDLLLQDVLPTFRRNEIVDMTSPWNYDYFAFLIPVHEETANINAVIKPFQWPVTFKQNEDMQNSSRCYTHKFTTIQSNFRFGWE